MNTEKQFLSNVIVVDANCDAYHALAIALRPHDVHVCCFSTGRDALRTIGAFPSALWIVNIQLPDISGVDLLRLIRHRIRRCGIILVGDDYSAEDELAARAAGATAYLCKPASIAWLVGCWPRCRSPAIRAGPEP
jgi:two-component system OmpR family response regulator